MSRMVKVSFPGGKKADAEMEGTVVRTDQAVEDGGEGSAPQPFQLFLASIAACAGIYAVEFCNARKLSTEGMALTMACDFDREQRLYTEMTLDLRLPAGFPEKYEAAIIRSMDLCAVKKHIVKAPHFTVRTSRDRPAG